MDLIKIVLLVLGVFTLIAGFTNCAKLKRQHQRPKDEQVGRVQIRAYRGPINHDKGEVYAPWGYFVEQPADY